MAAAKATGSGITGGLGKRNISCPHHKDCFAQPKYSLSSGRLSMPASLAASQVRSKFRDIIFLGRDTWELQNLIDWCLDNNIEGMQILREARNDCNHTPQIELQKRFDDAMRKGSVQQASSPPPPSSPGTGDPRAIKSLRKALRTRDAFKKRTAALALLALGDTRDVPRILRYIRAQHDDTPPMTWGDRSGQAEHHKKRVADFASFQINYYVSLERLLDKSPASFKRFALAAILKLADVELFDAGSRGPGHAFRSAHHHTRLKESAALEIRRPRRSRRLFDVLIGSGAEIPPAVQTARCQQCGASFTQSFNQNCPLCGGEGKLEPPRREVLRW
jgi:hypothetical protein